MTHIPYGLPALAEEKQRELIALARAGDEKARELLVRSNVGLIAKLAREFCVGIIELDDLVQSGIVGLLKAIKRFNLGCNTKLSTYAAFFIKLELQECAKDLASYLSYSQRDARRLGVGAMAGDYKKQIVSTREFREDILCLLAIKEEAAMTNRQREEWRNALNALLHHFSPRQQRLLYVHYGMGNGWKWNNMRETARQLGISHDTAHRIKNEILAKFRSPIMRKKLEGLL